MKTKRKKKAVPKGRPSKYRPVYAERAYKQALIGKTDAQLALYFDCSESTLNEWKKKHPEFKEAIMNGKDEADGKVAEGLYKRATGYQYTEQHREGGVLAKEIVKEVPPDPTAAQFWLKNRQKDHWKDKQEIEHTVTEKKVFEIGGQIFEF